MEKEEIDIFVEAEEGIKYIIEVSKTIKYNDLKRKIREIIKNNNFNILYKNKNIKQTKNEILILEPKDTIFVHITILEEQFSKKNLFNITESNINLSGILKFCLLKYIVHELPNLEKIEKKELKSIVSGLMYENDFQKAPNGDINITQNSSGNLLTYIKYINSLIKEKDIKDLINLLDKNKENNIKVFWDMISKYEDINKLFEKELFQALNKSHFVYSLQGLSIHQQPIKTLIEFLENINKCEQPIFKFLFYPNNNVSNIFENGFTYPKNPFYGMGIYFTDYIDYLSFFFGENTNNLGKTLPVNGTMSIIATGAYYDKEKKKNIYDFKYQINELDHYPNYEEICKDYRDKMVIKDGVHFIQVDPLQMSPLTEEKISLNKKNGKFTPNEYVITELSQLLPSYEINLKRNEYLAIWYDPNFREPISDYYNNVIISAYRNANINIYFENSIEKALELVIRKKYNKIILISCIMVDLSGKKFMEIARKILGFNALILFISKNYNHLKWIRTVPNVLYTDNIQFCEQYLINYNQQGLLNLKNETEQRYNIHLNFTNDFISFPNFVNIRNYGELIFKESCHYFRKVILKNNKNKKALYMNDNGNANFVAYDKKDVEKLAWYCTFINNEITLFSNIFYFGIDEDEEIKGVKFMTIWKYEVINEKYFIYLENKNRVLTIDKDNAIIKEENDNKENQLFDFIDLFDI